MNVSQVKEKAKPIKEKIGLESYPVGVKFIFSKNEQPGKIEKLQKHRYFQALMRARHGDHVLLDEEGISCPAAAAAFGFKQLPDGLKSGKALTGFGITKKADTGKEMFNGMTTLEPGKLEALYLFPLETAIIEPDIVAVEDQIEKLMWLALAYLNVKNGKRIESSTAILQAACVDAALIPFKQDKMNLSYGCYGCRDATDIGPDESVLGFPFHDFEKMSEYIEYLAKKAMPNTRNKKAFNLLKKESAEDGSKTDEFQTHKKQE